MSKDQLSFDQIIAGAKAADVAAAQAPKEAASEAQPQAATKERAKKKAAPPTGEFAKKDWSKLEMKTPSQAHAAKTLAAESSPEIAVEVSTQKSTHASTVREPAEASGAKPVAQFTRSAKSAIESGGRPTDTKSTAGAGGEASGANRAAGQSAQNPPPAPAVKNKEAAKDAAQETSAEPQVLSVSELNKHIREILEGRFPLLWVKGEISNFKAHTSGHFYFSIKDAKAQISAVMFRGYNSQLKFRPEDGMEVLIRGKVTVFEPRGNYQIFCELMEPVGAGALQKAYEQLKSKLQKEGLFDQARKRPLPKLPKHIAIVTSPTGAAIRDMLNVLGRRFKGAQITVIPCKVQGDQAPAEIIRAIEMANRLTDVDVMIVGRGGGSIEDLWAFNNEGVARAIAGAKMPVISAVGHEVDFTIADFVADLRAPTPSAAAELVVKNAADLADRVALLSKRMALATNRFIITAKTQLTNMSRRLIDPQRSIQDSIQRCDDLIQRLEANVLRYFFDQKTKVQLFEKRIGTPLARISHEREVVSGLRLRLRAGVKNTGLRKRESLEKSMAVLDSLSPLKVLDRGFSMVTVGDKVITDVSQVKMDQVVHVKMGKGSVDAKIVKIEKK